jgi:hypothetical protein
LNMYEEHLRVTHNGGDVPMVCTGFSSTWSVRPMKQWLDAQSQCVNGEHVQVSANSIPIWAGWWWRNYSRQWSSL